MKGTALNFSITRIRCQNKNKICSGDNPFVTQVL